MTPTVVPSAPPSVSAPVEVRGLVKRYGGTTVVDGLDLTVHHGEVFALLGPNGAGKTTTVEILQGVRHRSGGVVSVLGADPADDTAHWRSRIGVVPQTTGVHADLTVREVVRHFATFYPRPLPADEVVDMVGLGGKAKAIASSLSGGQQRRLDVAVAVVGDPELIFLDEPTTGLDPVARREAWELVRWFQGRGATTLLTTHHLDEAEALADRVGVVVAGRIVALDTPVALGGRGGGATVVSFRPGIRLRHRSLPRLPGDDVHDDGAIVTVSTHSPSLTLARLLQWARDAGDPELPELRVTRPTLEDVYLDLVATHDRESAA